jgi:energy-coupling factor transporter ATP-binding protein EcfA2
MTDKIKDWYEEANKELKTKPKVDKTFKNHYIKNNSMIALIGATGCGKSNAIIDFLARTPNKWYRILLFTGSTGDEPLYNFLKKRIDGIEIIDDPDALPEITDFNDEDKTLDKLAIFDDIICLPKKQMDKVAKWFICSRKWSFTTLCTAQNITSLPQIIRRNIHYFFLYHMNDANSINWILRTYNNGDDPKEIKKLYNSVIHEPKQFFMLDTRSNDETRYRKNFTTFLKIPNKNV